MQPFPARVAAATVSAVGNAVHLLPVLNSLKHHRPDVHTTCIMQPGAAGLLHGHPAVDEIVVFDRKRGWKGFVRLRSGLAERRFDLLINLQAYFKSGIVASLVKAPVKLGYDRARARELTWLFSTETLAPRPRAHVQDEYLEFVEHLGIPVRLEWGLEATDEERARYADLLPASAARTVALVLGTTRAEKEWPAERYAELVDRVDAMGARAVLVGGRSERESVVAEEVRRRALRAPLDLREWDLRRLVYLLGRADVVVSPDTGPLHISVALNTPTVALMGYTNPKRFGPYRRFHDLMVDAFGDPGEDYPPAAGHRPGRMARITVGQVAEKVQRALSMPRPLATG